MSRNGADSFSISANAFRHDKYLQGVNLERCAGVAAQTGISTRNGSQLTFESKNIGTAAGIDEILVNLRYEVICEISSAGCNVLG